MFAEVLNDGRDLLARGIGQSSHRQIFWAELGTPLVTLHKMKGTLSTKNTVDALETA